MSNLTDHSLRGIGYDIAARLNDGASGNEGIYALAQYRDGELDSTGWIGDICVSCSSHR